MKRVIVASIIITMMACSVAFAQKKSKPIKLKNEIDSISYVMGRLMGEIFDDSELEPLKKTLNHKVFTQAMQATMDGEEMPIDRYEAIAVVTEYASKMEQQEDADRLERGRKFLAENAKKKGVRVTSSGLQYTIEQEGNDEEYPDEDSYIVANIEGKTFEGLVFREKDSDDYFGSYIEDILAGMAEGLQIMSPGARYTFYLPYELGHGEDGASWKGVKPYDVLIYDVELIEISDVYSQVADCDGYGDCEYYTEEFQAPREAGDYWQTRAAEVTRAIRNREDMHDYHEDMTAALSVGDNYYIHMGDSYYSNDGAIVVADESGKQLQSLSTTDLSWEYNIVGLYKPLDDNSKDKTIVVICDLYNYDTETTFSDIYSQNNDGTLEYIGAIPMSIAANNYYYDNRRLIDVMSIESIKGGLRFKFDQHIMKYSMEGDYTHIPGEDIYYDYKYADGSFTYGGEATDLTFFKRQSLKRIVRGVNPELIDVMAMGDLNADGHIDVLYTRNDDSKIYINLCKDYKVDKKIVATFDTGYTFERDEIDKIISPKGEVSLYKYENNEYIKRAYILKDNKLVETETSKESNFTAPRITADDSVGISISKVSSYDDR